MRFVSIKSVEQQDIQALHRVRSRLVSSRTRLVNEMRGLLCEYGIVLPQGRQFAAWLGLVPRQYSTGGKPRLGGISKRGDTYLRKLLVQGGMAVLRTADGKLDTRSLWASKLKERAGVKKTAVAVANRIARTAWAVLSTKEEYKTHAVAA